MKAFIIFLLCSIIGPNMVCKGQSLEDYHLMGGISGGYRGFNLTDFNSYYSYTGLYKNPYAGTPLVSAWLEAKPLKKSRFTIFLGYDWIPDAKRNNEFAFIDTSGEAQSHGYDSVPYKINATVRIQIISLFIGYDLPLKKILLNMGAGITYNSFQTNEVQVYGDYSIDNRTIVNQYIYPPANLLDNKGAGFGFSLKATARYKLSTKLYATAALFANFVQIPLYDSNNQKILLNQSGIYVGSYYINNSTYLNADLSGLQANIGLQYVIF